MSNWCLMKVGFDSNLWFAGLDNLILGSVKLASTVVSASAGDVDALCTYCVWKVGVNFLYSKRVM